VGLVGGSADLAGLQRCRMMSSSSSWKTLRSLQVCFVMSLAVLVTPVAGLTASVALSAAAVAELAEAVSVASLAVSTKNDTGREGIHNTV
jgi:hypothetical protein